MSFNASANSIAKAIQKNREKKPSYPQNPDKRLGTISAVTPGDVRVSVILDGESDAASYVCAGNYFPIVSDRVLLEKVGTTWIVQCSVGAAIRPSRQTGITPVAVTAAASSQTAVVFPTPFASTPAVVTTINSGAGATARWQSRAINVTTTGFTIFIFSSDAAVGTFSGADVSWVASKTGSF